MSDIERMGWLVALVVNLGALVYAVYVVGDEIRRLFR